MAAESYHRYVALGDSQTEGLWDGDDTAGVRGFADRLADRLEELHPGVRYANLAVRGRRIRDVLDNQLPAAVEMHPDLITSCIGMNDVTRPGKTFGSALEDIDLLHDRLAETGATVVTTTFPDLEQILPVGRVLGNRVVEMNAVIRAAAARHGFRLVDLYAAESMGDPDVWSADRVHGSSAGHQLFAAAAAEALELHGSNHDWAVSKPDVLTPNVRSRMYSQAMWTQNLLMPWIWRHLRGLSSGNDREPKRPRLEPVAVELEPEAAEAVE
ncbi:lysophospholipase [Mycobacterium antarcticum]|uniref:SGNH/GDSL hydrolase family protein n=1 Tax=unclassified Mycolicibacterium TaxID=2636767 RepID=UPI0023936B19|nr:MULTISPECIES: SGNH/GDSL hydrolase family protein [unclassified Mycolicibacterium]BDX32173.1 lysophospholipase [Mycolicibacterium sp. TUM20985]GLP75480.1 lysophospholipase [Mycolicibacterium sp. TUM20983]GLP84259.1 lysophospholipase [Mycolicibacterium sp. TUM20984]